MHSADGTPEVTIDIETSYIRIGRATIRRSGQVEDDDTTGVFALTSQTLNLLESVAVCVQNNEPVLLVGGTGIGKTAAVQALARLSGKSLFVQNLSAQTDTSDLLGGFKPIQLRDVIEPLHDEFESLFSASFNVSVSVAHVQGIGESPLVQGKQAATGAVEVIPGACRVAQGPSGYAQGGYPKRPIDRGELHVPTIELTNL